MATSEVAIQGYQDRINAVSAASENPKRPKNFASQARTSIRQSAAGWLKPNNQACEISDNSHNKDWEIMDQEVKALQCIAFTGKSKEYGVNPPDDPGLTLPSYNVELKLIKAKVELIVLRNHSLQMMRFNSLERAHLILYLFGLISSKPTETYPDGPKGRAFTTSAGMTEALSAMLAAPADSILGKEMLKLLEDKGEPHHVPHDTLAFKEYWTQAEDVHPGSKASAWLAVSGRPSQHGYFDRSPDAKVLQGGSSGIDPTVRPLVRARPQAPQSSQHGSGKKTRCESGTRPADDESDRAELLEPPGSIDSTHSKSKPAHPPSLMKMGDDAKGITNAKGIYARIPSIPSDT
jgi:hypothetical protein